MNGRVAKKLRKKAKRSAEKVIARDWADIPKEKRKDVKRDAILPVVAKKIHKQLKKNYKNAQA